MKNRREGEIFFSSIAARVSHSLSLSPFSFSKARGPFETLLSSTTPRAWSSLSPFRSLFSSPKKKKKAAATMPRGPKKHLKRLNAPKHWMLGKLGGIFVSFVGVENRVGFRAASRSCSRQL
jgi:hypothetical protein